LGGEAKKGHIRDALAFDWQFAFVRGALDEHADNDEDDRFALSDTLPSSK
jgi:hypothetical protein